MLPDKVSLGSHHATPDGLCRHWRSTQASAILSRLGSGCSLLCKYWAIQCSKKCQTVKTAGTTKDAFKESSVTELFYKTDSAHHCQLDNFSQFSACLLSWASNNTMKALVISLLFFEYTIAPFPGMFFFLDQTTCMLKVPVLHPIQ